MAKEQKKREAAKTRLARKQELIQETKALIELKAKLRVPMRRLAVKIAG